MKFKDALNEWGGEEDPRHEGIKLSADDVKFIEAHDDIEETEEGVYTVGDYGLYVEKDLGRGKEYNMYSWEVSKDSEIIETFATLEKAYEFIKSQTE